jgi:hypothetical protein
LADHLPAQLTAKTVIGGLGLRRDESRLASVNRFGRFYLVPGRDSLCLLSTDRITGICWPSKVAEQGSAVTSAVCAPRLPPMAIEIAGFVPDHVDSVAIVSSTGTRLMAPVRGNLFVSRFETKHFTPRRVVWSNQRSTHRQTAGTPSSLSPGGCNAHTPPA